jgi:hypothetical protein
LWSRAPGYGIGVLAIPQKKFHHEDTKSTKKGKGLRFARGAFAYLLRALRVFVV